MASQVTRKALSELLGVELPENCEIIVRDLDATETSGGDAEMSEAELEATAGGRGIAVAGSQALDVFPEARAR